MNLEKLNRCRVKTGLFKTYDNQDYGLFFIPVATSKVPLKVICSPMSREVWQHVSVSLPNRCPSWGEMCKVKDLFWSSKDTVIQFHPKTSEYVNNHKYCLHLWKKNGEEFELPPSNLVGIK